MLQEDFNRCICWGAFLILLLWSAISHFRQRLQTAAVAAGAGGGVSLQDQSSALESVGPKTTWDRASKKKAGLRKRPAGIPSQTVAPRTLDPRKLTSLAEIKVVAEHASTASQLKTLLQVLDDSTSGSEAEHDYPSNQVKTAAGVLSGNGKTISDWAVLSDIQEEQAEGHLKEAVSELARQIKCDVWHLLKRTKYNLHLAACVEGSGENAKALGIVFYRVHQGQLQVVHLEVLDTCRREGVGKSLVQELQDVARLESCNAIVSCVPRGTTEAVHRFFNTTGFKRLNATKAGTEACYQIVLRKPGRNSKAKSNQVSSLITWEELVSQAAAATRATANSSARQAKASAVAPDANPVLQAVSSIEILEEAEHSRGDVEDEDKDQDEDGEDDQENAGELEEDIVVESAELTAAPAAVATATDAISSDLASSRQQQEQQQQQHHHHDCHPYPTPSRWGRSRPGEAADSSIAAPEPTTAAVEAMAANSAGSAERATPIEEVVAVGLPLVQDEAWEEDGVAQVCHAVPHVEDEEWADDYPDEDEEEEIDDEEGEEDEEADNDYDEEVEEELSHPPEAPAMENHSEANAPLLAKDGAVNDTQVLAYLIDDATDDWEAVPGSTTPQAQNSSSRAVDSNTAGASGAACGSLEPEAVKVKTKTRPAAAQLGAWQPSLRHLKSPDMLRPVRPAGLSSTS